MLKINKTTQSYRLMSEYDYRLLREAYYGDGGFLNGSYIKKHTRETENKLRSRREIAYYLNYVSPVVNSHVGPIFAKPQVRDWKQNSELFAAFCDDVDREGTSIEFFMKSAAITAKLFGTVYIVVDNVTGGEMPANVSDAVKRRAFPYAYLVHPCDVIDIEKDAGGGLARFEYLDGYEKKDSAERMRRVWTRDRWELNGATGGDISGENRTGVVPVIALHSRKPIRLAGISDGFIPSPSEFLSIARANVRIYNLCSELDEIIRNQAFSVLCYPGKDINSLTVGTDSALGWDGEKYKTGPYFIAPPADPANIIMTQIDRLIKEIYRMAMLTHAVGVQEATSGIAKAWDFEKTNQALADFASNLEEAERKIVDLFGLWANEDIDYICSYSSDYSITDTQQLISDTLSLLDMNLKSRFQAAVKKKLARVILSNSPDAEHDAVMAELDAEAEDAVYGDSLENPSASTKYTAVGIAEGIVTMLKEVQAGTLSPEAAKIVLVVTYGLSEQAADDAIRAQAAIANEPPESTAEPGADE